MLQAEIAGGREGNVRSVIVASSQPHASELKRPLRLNLEMLMDLSVASLRGSGGPIILPAVFVTDRLGEVFAAYQIAHGKKLRDIEEILS